MLGLKCTKDNWAWADEFFEPDKPNDDNEFDTYCVSCVHYLEGGKLGKGFRE